MGDSPVDESVDFSKTKRPILPPIKGIGDYCDGWSLMLPTTMHDQTEEWVAIDDAKRIAIVLILRKSPDDCIVIEFIDDIKYYLSTRRYSLADLRKNLPTNMTYWEFAKLAKMYGGLINKTGNYFSASWHNSSDLRLMYVFYGRLMERVDNPNDVILLDKKIIFKQDFYEDD